MRRSACSAERKDVCPLATCGTSTVEQWISGAGRFTCRQQQRCGTRSQLGSSVVTLDGDELRAWLVQHPPPRLTAFGSRDEWDAEREPWFEQLMGERLPLYGDNEARTAAWQTALKRAERGAMPQAALELLDGALPPWIATR